MRKPLFNQVTIVGVGLIGGSLGLAIKKRKLARLVVGVVHRKKTIAEAFHRKALDVATLDLKEGVKGADLVILCGPISAIIDQLRILARFLDKKTVVIDVGSSKEKIDQTARKYLTHNAFVGCHPMAGSEKQGVVFADAGLFKGAICFVTRSHSKVNRFWGEIGARPALISPERHDNWVARTSHLPHVLSFALFDGLKPEEARQNGITEPNPSLRGFMRLAQSDPRLWADILVSNREMVMKNLKAFERSLQEWQKLLKQGNSKGLAKFIKKANRVSGSLASK